MAVSAASRYTQLQSKRDPYLRRARACAKLTIPALMPPEGSDGNTEFPTPYQSLGARGVNNLAAKLLLSLLPPNASFVRFLIDDFTLEQLTKKEGMRAQVEEALGKVERAIMTQVETSSLRVTGFEVFKQLINSGNVLLYTPDEGDPRAYRLDRYVVRRDVSGNVLEAIVKEDVSPAALEPDVRALLPSDFASPDADEKAVALYTVMRRDGKKWKLHQEIQDKLIPGTESTAPIDSPPMLPLRFIKVDGESYGRSYVEEYFGDLKSLEGLEAAIVQGSAAAAKVLFLVNPNGTTKRTDVSSAPTGAVRAGNADDVTVLQMGKYADFRVAQEKTQDLQTRLAHAFLLNSAIQRNGERVTAEEIRFMARELEDALGGVYSIMSQEFQLPLVKRLMSLMQRSGTLPTLPKGVVRPSIITGMEALGRGHDIAKLDEFFAGIPTEAKQFALSRINWSDYLTRRGTALGMDLKGLIKTEAQIAQEQAQAQQAQMAQALVDKGTAPAIKGAADAMAQQQQPPQQ